MCAFCNAAVAKALLIVAGFFASGGRPPAIGLKCAAPAGVIFVSPSADTARAERPAKPEKPKSPVKPVTITITDDGINVDGKGTMKIEVDAEKLDELSTKINRDLLEKLEGLPESLEAFLGDEYDAKRFYHIKGSDVVRFGSDVVIDMNELVNGNVVAIASDIRVEGKVTGDVMAVLGSVELGSDAIVNGEVVSIFGSIEREDGSVIRGETAVIGGSYRRHGGITLPFTVFGGGLFGGVGKVLSLIIGILLMLILLFFIPRRMRCAADYTTASLLKSFGLGLLLFFGGIILVVILAIILAITIVGIPVAVLLVFSFAALLFIGYLVSALALGSFVTRRCGVESDSLYLQAIVGLFLLSILGIVAAFMTMSPIFGPARVMIRAIGGIIQFVAVVAGAGAFILSRAGTRPSALAQGPVGSSEQP
jgi:hypothetical protein